MVTATPALASAQVSDQEAVRVSLANGSADEQRAWEQLTRILTTWDLSQWLFTRDVRIEANVIPHSHPVLTLNTNYLDNDTAQTAIFIHEQLHWFFVRHSPATRAAIADLEKLFPEAPSSPPDGARDRHSTYLHLLVCQLEYDALRYLFGDAPAWRTIAGWQHYRWVFRQVLERPEAIRQVVRSHGLDAPDARRGREAAGSTH